MTKLSQYISSTKKFDNLYKLYTDSAFQKCSKQRRLKILILNAPCGGFGDLIFAKKLCEHLRATYNVSVTIATTEPEKILMLGEKKQNLCKLAYTDNPTDDVTPCRVFKRLRLFSYDGKKSKSTDLYDLFFVAPVAWDNEPSLKDVLPLVPKATHFNTFFFSEYNDSLQKKSDFQTGVGNNRDGLLLTSPKSVSNTHIKNLLHTKKHGPYALVYVAEIDNSINCIAGFLEMISKKYNNHKHFQVVVPSWLIDSKDIIPPKIYRILQKYWRHIKVSYKIYSDPVLQNLDGNHNSDNVLHIRADILPVKNDVMLGLIRESVDDILLTGDQSITDALSCCYKTKNIFYQIAPWKTNFGKNLAKLMPNKFLAKQSTSCGSIAAIKYNSNYTKFVKNNNFFKNIHKRLKGIFCIASQYKDKKSEIHKFINIVNDSKSLTQVKHKLKHPENISIKKSRKKSNRKSRRRNK